MSIKPRLSSAEFIVLMALISATVAFSIDAMLPAMGKIAEELTPDAPNRAQLIITSFVFGMGIGTLFAGPLCDAFGRRTVVVGGALIYCIGSYFAWTSASMDGVVIARVLQGVGAAGPRIASLAITRDLYAGRQMARVMSLMMMVFVLVPSAAPLIGSWIMAWIGWRGIFLAFILFSVFTVTWLLIRQPETLTPEARRPLNFATLWDGTKEICSIPRVLLSLAAQCLTFCMIFFMITTSQQVFDITFDREASFPWWFAMISLLSACGAFVNSKIVPTLGMRAVIIGALSVQACLSLVFVLVIATGVLPDNAYFAMYLLWILSVFMVAGGMAIGKIQSRYMAK